MRLSAPQRQCDSRTAYQFSIAPGVNEDRKKHEKLVPAKGNSKFCKLTPHEITNNYAVALECLQCFDAVGWAAGRASGL